MDTAHDDNPVAPDSAAPDHDGETRHDSDIRHDSVADEAPANEAEQVDDSDLIEDPRVRAAIERLADLEGLPVAEQVEVFADVHARLTEALGTDNHQTGSDTSSSAPSDPANATGQVSFGDPAS